MTKRRIAYVHASPAVVVPLAGFYQEAALKMNLPNLLDGRVLLFFTAGQTDRAGRRLAQTTGRVLPRLEVGAGVPVLSSSPASPAAVRAALAESPENVRSIAVDIFAAALHAAILRNKQIMKRRTSRRKFLRVAAGGATAVSLARVTTPVRALDDRTPAPLRVSIFSKHLQWLDWEAMARTAAEVGFDGVDLTVRRDGHVAPERAEQDLPKVADIIRRAGLSLPMITTGIVNADTPHAESVLRAMKSAGVTHYRWGGFRYEENKSIPARLEELKKEVAKLAELNQKYNVCAMYHTHSGTEVGASVWDLWLLLKDSDAARVSINYDIAHATIEGGLGGWRHSARLAAPLMRGVAIKDFRWGQSDRGEWRPQWCPLGEGMVNFKRFLPVLKEAKFAGPLQLHLEYPLGGADKGARTLTIGKAKVIAALRRDLETLRGWLREARLS